jgi:hypothetical protein
MTQSEKKQDWKKGDVVRAKNVPNKSIHACVLLKDSDGVNQELQIDYCNFTGSQTGEYHINVSEFKLPFFKKPKPETWLRCDDSAFIKQSQIVEYVGNIFDHPDVLAKVCSETVFCEIAGRLKSICEGNYTVINNEVGLGRLAKGQCLCTNPTVQINYNVQNPSC